MQPIIDSIAVNEVQVLRNNKQTGKKQFIVTFKSQKAKKFAIFGNYVYFCDKL